MSVKIPPHSVEAEQALLGALMIDVEAFDKIVDKLIPRDFYRADHRLIFAAMQQLNKSDKPIDIITVIGALTDAKQLDDAGGEVYIFTLANNCVSSANIVAYSDAISGKSVLRHLVTVCSEIGTLAMSPGNMDATDVIDTAERKVLSISDKRKRDSEPQLIAGILAETLDHIDHLRLHKSALLGTPTGFTALDDISLGLHPGDLTIIAARPGMGKTTLAMNIAEHVVMRGLPVVVFSMEMSCEGLMQRILSSLTRVELKAIRTGKMEEADWQRVASAVGMIGDSKLYIDETQGLSPMDMRARARRVSKECKGLGLIVVDYLQMMKIPGYNGGNNRTMEVTEISRSLKGLAKELKCPVIALSQLNRNVDGRSDKRPTMSDLRDSGSIEQDADMILFIYRDEFYNQRTPLNADMAEIIVSKHRNGEIGDFKLKFQGKYTRFDNMEKYDYGSTN